MTVPPVDGPTGQRLARAELSRPEYRNGGRSWLQQALDAVGRWLESLFGGGGGGAGGGTMAALVVLGVLVLALVVVALVRAGRLPGRRPRTGRGSDPLAPEAGVDHAARGADLAARGDLGGATREYLRDAVATLERRGVLDARPGRTGAAAAHEGGVAVPGARADLAAGAAAFDAVWFGGRAAVEADVAAARRAAETVRRETAGRETRGREAAGSGSRVDGRR